MAMMSGAMGEVLSLEWYGTERAASTKSCVFGTNCDAHRTLHPVV